MHLSKDSMFIGLKQKMYQEKANETLKESCTATGKEYGISEQVPVAVLLG